MPNAVTIPDARFGARTLFAGIAAALVAVPFGLILFLVEDRWAPLSRVDAARATACTASRSTTKGS